MKFTNKRTNKKNLKKTLKSLDVSERQLDVFQ